MRQLLALLILAVPLASAQTQARVEILVNGSPRPEFFARGTTYIEALKGQEYEIRLTNPYPVRAAVALAVDGLNTIDAKHTDARSARKWVLEPYQSITLRGWQTSSDQARRFFFTSEQKSYGQWLGQTENLGVISAAFFRERVPYPYQGALQMKEAAPPPPPARGQAGPGAGAASQSRVEVEPNSFDKKAQARDLAATGIGNVESHPVTRVNLDLEDRPAEVVSIRYEYRAALVALGVIPPPHPPVDALNRRENARGFSDYCPSPR